MTASPERVLLIVEADGDCPEGLSIRLRHLLKAMVRRFGLRTVWVQDAPDWHFGDVPAQSSRLHLDAESVSLAQRSLLEQPLSDAESLRPALFQHGCEVHGGSASTAGGKSAPP